MAQTNQKIKWSGIGIQRPQRILILFTLIASIGLLTASSLRQSDHEHAGNNFDENFSISQSANLNTKNEMDILTIDQAALSRAHWSDTEKKNVELVVDFIQHLMNSHDFDYVREKFGDNHYTQHNKGIPDGMRPLIDYVESFTKRFPDYAYDVKHIYADGDHVTFHSHVTTNKKHRGNGNKGFNIIDTWRIENGEVAEHWDAIQPINGSMRLFMLLTGGKTSNSNGLF